MLRGEKGGCKTGNEAGSQRSDGTVVFICLNRPAYVGFFFDIYVEKLTGLVRLDKNVR